MNIDDVLRLIKDKIEAINPVEDKYLRSKGNDNGFEELFPKIAAEVEKDIHPQHTLKIKKNSEHHFPDVELYLDDKKYGIELKFRNNGSWTTNGNSVFESITGEDYIEIYTVFATKVHDQKRLLVKYAPYWRSLSSIKVTHSPRFAIDMKMDPENDGVFKSKEQYDSFRAMSEEEKIKFLQNYLKQHSVGAKWYIAPTETISPTKYSDLSLEKKLQLKAELFILFPDDLLGCSGEKYERSAEYLLETYYVYNKSIRDIFSAGGKYEIRETEFPKIIGTLVEVKKPLEETLNVASDDFFNLAKKYWRENLPNELIKDNLYDSYKAILDHIGSKTYNELLEKAGIPNLSALVFDSH